MPVPAVHRGKGTTQKTLENICNAHMRGTNIVGRALRAVQTDASLLR